MPDTLTADELAQIKALAEKATPGPWKAYKKYSISIQSKDYSICEFGDEYKFDDAKFMAAARTAVPQLIAEVERLRAALLDIIDNSNSSTLQWWFFPDELKPETMEMLTTMSIEADEVEE